MSAAEAIAWTRRGTSDDHRDANVYVSDSRFLGSMGINGKGLYASRPFRAREYIQEYLGKKITDEQAERKKRFRNYMFDVKRRGRVIHVLDGAQKRHSSAARYVNAANHASQQNAHFVQSGEHILLRALKPIPKNREIIAWYGADTGRVIAQH